MFNNVPSCKMELVVEPKLKNHENVEEEGNTRQNEEEDLPHTIIQVIFLYIAGVREPNNI